MFLVLDFAILFLGFEIERTCFDDYWGLSLAIAPTQDRWQILAANFQEDCFAAVFSAHHLAHHHLISGFLVKVEEGKVFR